jgi:hypothetical protein
MKNVFLIVSVVLTLGSVIPYMIDTVRRKTKPNIVSWMTWSLLTGIATAAAISAGEIVAAVYTGVATLGTFVVVLLGVKYGHFRYTRFDVACQAAAVVGIVIWQIFNSPGLGVVAAVTVDFVGALPTLRHAWLKPSEETWQTYAIGAVGGLFAVLALSTYNWVNTPYAAYIVLANTVLPVIIISRRRAGIKG